MLCRVLAIAMCRDYLPYSTFWAGDGIALEYEEKYSILGGGYYPPGIRRKIYYIGRRILSAWNAKKNILGDDDFVNLIDVVNEGGEAGVEDRLPREG